MNTYLKVEELKGKTLISVEASENEIIFTTVTNEKYKMFHEQDCCESVTIEEISGDFSYLLHYPIIMAEEVTETESNEDGSGTYTFYKLGTINGQVTIRWYGESNGYYSESVDFIKLKE
jgi:hypothetical protein